MFNEQQKSALAASLHKSNVKSRQQGGRSVCYIEGWKVIEEANRIFGFDSWTRETTEIKCVAERERTIGSQQKPGWGVSYIARVRVVVFAGDTLVTREGIGAGHGIDIDLGQAHESAIKEAETDAMKRALMTFGYPFGLALYDKQQEHVADDSHAKEEAPEPRPLLSEPAASEVQARFIEDVNGCITLDEMDKFIKSDGAKRRYASLPTKHRGYISQAIKVRRDQLAAKVAA